VLVIACLDPESGMVSLQISIQQPQLGDDAAARIGQLEKFDPSGAGKFA